MTHPYGIATGDIPRLISRTNDWLTDPYDITRAVLSYGWFAMSQSHRYDIIGAAILYGTDDLLSHPYDIDILLLHQICAVQIKYGFTYCVTCPSMRTDPGFLNLGTRRSRVPGWWDPGIRTWRRQPQFNLLNSVFIPSCLIMLLNAEVLVVVIIQGCVQGSWSHVSDFNCYSPPPSDTECQ